MDIPVAQNVPTFNIPLDDYHQLLCWVNACLQTDFTHMRHLRTGATYCQLMHILFPTSIDLSSVRFESDSIEDYRHNYSLLQKAFDQVGVLRYIPVNDLIHKNEAACLQFLRWFKVFFIKNDKHRTQAHGNALRLPISSGVVDVITKVVPPKPVQPVEEAEKLGKDSLKPNDVVLKSTNEDKQKEEDTQTIANEAPVENVNQKTLKTLELSEDQDSQPVTPAKDAEELRRDCLNTSDNNLNSPNQDKLVEDKISNVTPVEKITQHTSNPLVTLKTFINQNFTQTTNSKCTASISSTSNNLMLVCSQPLYYLYLNVAPVNQAKQATMSTMKTNDIILISDNEDKPDEGKPIMVTNGTPLENINEKTLLPLKSAVTNTQSSLHLSSQPKTHPKDLKEACSQSPYCLYVDMGLELNEKVCSALIGYCDQLSGASVVKMLDTLYITENSADEIPIPVITKHTASAAADRLISLLKKSELPLNNLAVFYCNVPDPEVNWMITLKLKEFNPHLVSLGALGCIAGSACQIGLMSCYSHVVDLINDIQYFKLPSSFTETNYNPMFSVSLQYSATINIIQKIAVHWEELVEFFKAMNTKVGSNRGLLILNKLQEPKFKLEFMFLSHALEPLRAFRGLQKNKTRDMVVELQMTTMLISAYATSILPPSAAEEFLRNKDLEMLFSLKELLPMSNINVGFQARKFLVTQSFAELGEEMRSKFLTQAVSFYQTMLKISVESLPGQLTPVTIKNIGTLLKHPKNLMSNEISSKQLTELANQLGVCKTDASISQLASEYVNYIQKANQGQKKNEAKEEEGEGHWWVKVLDSLEQFPLLHELILTLLAFPRSLQMKQVFNKPQQTHVSPRSPRRQKGRKWKFLSHRSEKVELISSDEEDYSQSKPKQPSSNIVATMNREKHSEESECTDNSSDVVDVTEECKFKLSLYPNIGSKVTEKSESIYMLDRGESKSKPPSVTPSQTPATQGQQGELVLIHLEASVSWPGVTVPSLEDKQEPDMKKVQWYGHSMTSEVCIEYLRPFRDFARCFCQNTFATVAAYKEAVFLSLREASARCQKHFYLSNDEKNNKEKILMEMLDWAFGGFKPTGPSGFEPVGCENPEDTLAPFQVSTTVNIQGKVQPEDLPKVSVSLYKINTNSFQTSDKVGGVDSAEKSVKKKSKTGWKGGKGSRKKSPLLEDLDDNDSSPDFVPYKKRAYTKSDQQNKNNTQTREYAQPDQKVRERIISKIMELKLDIDGFCLCCGTEDVVIFHPLFQGSLCSECKGNFAETLYRYDEDGYQSYCTICCYGNEVLLCGNDSCCRSFCADCLNILVCQGTFDSLKLLDPWICYLCQPHQTHGALTPREDWSIRVQELFANNSAMEFVSH